MKTPAQPGEPTTKGVSPGQVMVRRLAPWSFYLGVVRRTIGGGRPAPFIVPQYLFFPWRKCA